MKCRVKIIAIFVLMSTQAYSQKILPATSIAINKKLVEQCQKMVDDMVDMNFNKKYD